MYEPSTSIQLPQPCRKFKLHEILKATKDFDKSLIIGSGGFGKVYIGEVYDGARRVHAAIKRLDSLSSQGATEFWAEIENLSKLRHYNLVSLIGYCNYERKGYLSLASLIGSHSYKKEMILVYEYMPNKTLKDHLHKLRTPLSWELRLQISIGVCRGLHYLHTCNGTPTGVIHRDVKSSNILLSERWAAKISDFGLSKIGPANQLTSSVLTDVKGTFGYLDPNYFKTRKLTRKSDVYSLGVVLFEVLCRKPAVEQLPNGEARDLVTRVQDSFKDGSFMLLIDSDIRGEISQECLKEYVDIANACLRDNPKQRPTMVVVVARLEHVLALQKKSTNSSQSVSKTAFDGMVNEFPNPSDGENSSISSQFVSRALYDGMANEFLVPPNGENSSISSQFVGGMVPDGMANEFPLPSNEENSTISSQIVGGVVPDGMANEFLVPSSGENSDISSQFVGGVVPDGMANEFPVPSNGEKLDISSQFVGGVVPDGMANEFSVPSNGENSGWIKAPILLHGTLHVTIYEVDKIHTYGGGNIFSKIVANKEKIVGFGKGTRKIYATINLEKAQVGRTRMIEEPRNPRWYESFHIYCAHSASNVIFTVKDDNPIGATLIGRAYIPVEELLDGEETDRWVEILDEDKNPIKAGSKIHVKLQYFDVTQDRSWARGVKSAKYPGVPYTFFAQRRGCRVSLYQDAHVPDNFIPTIPLANGEYYKPHRCWEDICDAITNAKHFIYITGWSVYTEITLIRDSKRPKPGGDATLGELLKQKASEGVRVLMLIWDDRTSVGILKKDGLMATHDEDTENYFIDTDVHCVLCPRNPDDGASFIQDLQISTMFTHHQKIVVVDAAMPSGESTNRRVVSFVGGIDLCDGRYDSPFHSLFRTLDSAHDDDFHQPNYTGASITKGGPREPWHDIHSRLEGPVAWDVLFNFEQRWRKQGGKDILVNLRELSDIITPPSPVTFPDDQETWNVQLFRSIDGGAAFGFPDKPEDAAKAGLVSGKDNIIDRSIQDAYIHAIRRAKRFIYIENQYFLGSSHAWEFDDVKGEDVGALHLIPKELSLKIVSKIKAHEKFTVYIVVPMWPEGIPESASVQAILDWQRRTMEMMYKDIVQALRAEGLEESPRDYLTFFCLGNREVKKSREYEASERPDPDSDYMKAQEARRFMIYVHSKMMIVDDEYIIVGSANINQRSMDGARDSELAMGAYQPYHLSTRNGPARGQVYGFRMALWYEHLGMLDDAFHHPESTECVRKVNRIADKYWELYSSENLEHDMPGHLLRYPIRIASEGNVTVLPGTEYFPDTKSRVLGAKSDYLPPILTS